MGFDAPDDIDAVIEDSERLIFEVTSKRVESNFRPMEELLKLGFHQLEELFERKEHVTGVPTGFKDLDKLLAGLHAGDLAILAARPSVGKTALALNIAVNAAKKGTSVALFSLEMSAEQLVQRVLCSEARINLQDVRTGYIKEQDWGSIHQAMGRLAELDFWVDDTPVDLDLRGAHQGAPAAARQAEGPHHRRLPAAHAAAAPALRAEPHGRDRRDQPRTQDPRQGTQRAGARALAALPCGRAARRQAAAAFGPSRVGLDRAGRRRGHVHRPQHRPARRRTQDGRPAKGMAELIIAKHRNGPTGSVPLVFNERFTKFMEPAKMG